MFRWRRSAENSSIPVPIARYTFLLETKQKRVLHAALIYVVVISLSLAIIIAVFTEALRRRATSTARDAR